MDTDDSDQFGNTRGLTKVTTRKHLAERQRRARINSYLEEIEILTSTGSQVGPTKLEKAEVLERAVVYIQHNQPTPTQDSKDKNNNDGDTDADSSNANSVTPYKNGFGQCMTTLLSYIDNDPDLRQEAAGLKSHLDSFIDTLTTAAEAEEDLGIDMADSNQSNDMYQCNIQSGMVGQIQSQIPHGYDVNRENSQSQHMLQNVSVSYASPQYDMSVMPNQYEFDVYQQQYYTTAHSPHIQALQMMQGYFNNQCQVLPGQRLSAKDIGYVNGDEKYITANSGDVDPTVGTTSYSHHCLQTQGQVTTDANTDVTKLLPVLDGGDAGHKTNVVWRPW